MSLLTLSRTYREVGAYSIVGKTGTMAAGLAAAAPVFAFRWSPSTSSLKAVVDRIRFSVASLGTGFTAGIGYLEAVAARSYTAPDYGGKAAPTTTSAVAAETGGALAAGAYFYNVTALGAWGETVLSTERTASITGSEGAITLTYGTTTGATGFRIYRGAETGVYTHHQDDAASTFVDTGAGWIAGGPGAQAGGGAGLTLTTNNAKRLTSQATTELAQARLSDTVALVAGTRTLDAQPFAAVQFPVSTATNAVHLATTAIWAPDQGESPFVLVADEGFIVRATVPATGTWQGIVTIDWREVR